MGKTLGDTEKKDILPAKEAVAPLKFERIEKKTSLAKVLRTIGISSVLSFAISESGFLFFQNVMTPEFPESILVVSLLVVAGTAITDAFFSDEIAFLTLVTSSASIVIMIDLLFGTAPKPAFFPISNSIEIDAIIMVVFSLILYFSLETAFEKMKSGKVKTNHVLLVFLAIGIAVVLYLSYVYFSAIISYFDSHPWVVTVLGIIFSAIASFLVTRRYRGRK